MTGKIRESEIKEGRMSERIVRRKPKSSCKKCYGRGYIGWAKSNNLAILCTCVNKV